MAEVLTMQIPLAEVIRDPGQPRTHFDQEALQELADSIVLHGLLQPIVVRPCGDKWMIVAGERRTLASRLAGLEFIEARILGQMEDREAFILATSENVVRRDLDPIEEAKAYQRVMSDLGRDVAGVAKLFGKSVAIVTGRLALLGLRDDLQHLVARGQLSISLGVRLSQLGVNEQAEVLHKLTTGECNEEEIGRLCSAIVARVAQSGLFGEAQVFDEAVASKRRETRTKIAKEMAKLAALTSCFQAVLELDAGELAAALGIDVRPMGNVAAEVARLAGRVSNRFAEATAINDAEVHLAKVESRGLLL